MFRNTHKQGAEVPTFDKPVRVVNGAFCPQPSAVADMHDLAVRFGDLDGGGRVDVRTILPDLVCFLTHTAAVHMHGPQRSQHSLVQQAR